MLKKASAIGLAIGEVDGEVRVAAVMKSRGRGYRRPSRERSPRSRQSYDSRGRPRSQSGRTCNRHQNTRFTRRKPCSDLSWRFRRFGEGSNGSRKWPSKKLKKGMIATTLTKNKLQVSFRQEFPGKFSASVSLPKTDEELARKATAGDMDAFEELVRRRRQGLVRFLASFSQSASDAEDLAQETFLRAYRNLSRYDPRKPFLTWLYVIARRLAINFKRNRLRRGESPLPEREIEISREIHVHPFPIPTPSGKAHRNYCLPMPLWLSGFTMGKTCR